MRVSLSVNEQQCQMLQKKKKLENGDIPGSPGVKTPHFHCRECRSDMGQGTKIPRAASHSQKKEEKNLISIK